MRSKLTDYQIPSNAKLLPTFIQRYVNWLSTFRQDYANMSPIYIQDIANMTVPKATFILDQDEKSNNTILHRSVCNVHANVRHPNYKSTCNIRKRV